MRSDHRVRNRPHRSCNTQRSQIHNSEYFWVTSEAPNNCSPTQNNFDRHFLLDRYKAHICKRENSQVKSFLTPTFSCSVSCGSSFSIAPDIFSFLIWFHQHVRFCHASDAHTAKQKCDPWRTAPDTLLSSENFRLLQAWRPACQCRHTANDDDIHRDIPGRT